MESVELSSALREILIKNSRLRLAAIRDEDRLAADLGYDSFAMLNAVLEIEDRFGIEVDAARLHNLREMTFRELVELVARHIASSPAPTP